MEVQGKMQELSRALRQISMRLQMNEREMRKCKITVQDLGTLPPTTPMYRAAGSIAALWFISYGSQVERMSTV